MQVTVGGVRSILTVTDWDASCPAPFVAEQVRSMPDVSPIRI
jgi:hypothetical protein